MLNATAQCGLSAWNELAIYSYLVYRAGQKSKFALTEQIARGLRLDRKTVAKVLPALHNHRLVSKLDNGRWAANEPPEDKRGWFLMVKRSNTATWDWYKRFAGYWCYVTVHLEKDSMSPRQSAIFWKIYNWQQDNMAPVKKAWRTQTLIPYRTVLDAVSRLREMGLLDQFGRVTLDKSKHAKYWLDKPPKKKPPTTKTLREWFFDWWEDTAPHYFPNIEELGDRLDYYQEQLLAVGYTQKDILSYFDKLIDLLDGYFDPCEVFLQRGFWGLLARVEKTHEKNGFKYPNSLGLLKHETRSVARHLLRALKQDELYAWELPSPKQ